MSQPLPPDALRVFIMYDVLSKRDPFEAYKTFCKVTNNPNYDYVEYEYWYYYFYNGNTDMDHDRSLDPIQATILDLPNDMLEEIFVHLDFENRAKARKVCSQFRATMDQINTQWPYFDIEIDHKTFKIQTFAYKLEYLKSGFYDGFSTVLLGSNQRKLLQDDWLDCAFSDLGIYLKSSRMEIDVLNISLRTTHGVYNRLIRLLKSSGALFNVKSVYLHSNYCAYASSILASLQPETLESIHLYSLNREYETICKRKFDMIEKIIQLEQFKRAKHFSTTRFAHINPSLIRHFCHLKTFDIRLTNIDAIDAKLMLQIREDLSNNANFEECEILTNEPLNLLKIGTALGAKVNPDQKRLDYSYLQNGETLQFIFTMNSVRVRRNEEPHSYIASDDSTDDFSDTSSNYSYDSED